MENLLRFSIVIFSASRIPQIASNYWLSSTGSLSALSQFMMLAGSLARIFTTISTPNYNRTTLVGFVIGASLNLILFSQILFYWGKKTESTSSAKFDKKKKE
jgi:mannose-P-dolichol utilization defect protein 1